MRFLCLLLLLQPALANAQQPGQVRVHAEIVPSTLTLSVSSAQLRFGRISQDADAVIIDPSTGERSGRALGPHSVASIQLSGTPGISYNVTVSAPPSLTANSGSGREPFYGLLWARSPSCTDAAYTDLTGRQSHQDIIGPGGCARLQFGGLLNPNGAAPGIYQGRMTVQITQL